MGMVLLVDIFHDIHVFLTGSFLCCCCSFRDEINEDINILMDQWKHHHLILERQIADIQVFNASFFGR